MLPQSTSAVESKPTTLHKRPWRPPYPREQKALAIALLRRPDVMIEDIVARVGLKESVLRTWAAEQVIPLRGRRARKLRLNQRDIDICELLLSNDITLTETGSRFGLSKERVRQICRRFGIRRRS